MTKIEIDYFPGSEHVLIITNIYVEEKQRNYGVATSLVKSVEKVAIALDVNLILCVVDRDNKQMQHILHKCGWLRSEEILENITSKEETTITIGDLWIRRMVQ